jgi:DNA-damage-inducible protein J
MMRFTMANGTTIQARIDPKVKRQARDVLDKLGISMSEAIGVYIRQIVLRQAIPFELKLPNQATLQAIEELESGKGVTFDSADELFKDLES